jgi:DNA-binding transcriptional LysR family regulator
MEGKSMIVHEKNSVPYRVLHEFIDKNKLNITISLELSSNRAIKRAVESNLGIALISRKVAEEEIQTGKLVAFPLPDRTMSRKFYTVRHKDKYISAILQRLMDRVDQWAHDYAGRLS